MLDTRHWTAGARAGCGGCWVWWLLGAGGSIYSSKYAFVFTPFVLLF